MEKILVSYYSYCKNLQERPLNTKSVPFEAYVMASKAAISTNDLVYSLRPRGRMTEVVLLRNINVNIEKASMTAIMGPSGSGPRSIVVTLLLRFDLSFFLSFFLQAKQLCCTYWQKDKIGGLLAALF